MISRHLQQYVDNNCVGGAQMDVLLEDGVDGAKRAVIRLSEMDDDKEDVNIRLRRHDDNTADCVFGSRGMADESQVFHDAAEKVVEWMMGELFEGKGKERKCKLKTVTQADAKTLIKMLKDHDARRDKSPKIAKGSKKAAEAAAVEGNEYVQAERATHAAIMYSIGLDQHPRREKMEIASTWTAAVDVHQTGLSKALATHKGKALKGKGKGKEVEVADAPVSLLEKWEKSPVSQDDDDILDVNDEIAKGKRLRQQLAVQPRDLDEMSKALVHRNRVWTRNLFVGPQKLLARDLHLSRAEQNATIFANSESDYGHDKLVIPVWRYSFQFLADRCPNTFHDWMKKEDTQRQVAQLFGDIAGSRTMKAGYARAMTDKEIDIYLRTSSAKGMAEAASTRVLTGPADMLDDLKPVDVRKAALLDSLCKSAWEMVPIEPKPQSPPAICGFLVLDGNHFTTLIKSVRFELVTPNMTVDQRSVWYKAMLNGFMKAEKLRVVARGGKEQEVTKTVAAAKLEEWATDWTKFGGVDVQMLKGGTILPTWWQIREQKKGEQAKAEGDGAGDKAGGAEETDKWGPDQKNFMQRWLFWCEDPLKPVVDGKPAIAQDIAARQDFLDARPKDKAHELSIFTAHRELASFQYFDSLIQAPIMSGEAPPSNLIKIMEVAKNLIEAAKQFAHIKFLEKPKLIGSCRQLNGTFDPVVVREQVFGVKLKGTFATDLDKFIAECRLTRDFWRVVVTATRAIILTLRDLPQAKRKVVDQKDWKFPRGLLASHPRHLYDDLGVKTKHLLGVPEAAAAEEEVEEEEEGKGTAKAKRGWRDRLEGFSCWKGKRVLEARNVEGPPTVSGKGEEETPVRFPRGSASGTVSGEAGRVVGQAAVGAPVAQPGAGGDELPPNAPTHAPPLPCGQPEKTYEELMAEAAAAQGQKAKRRGGGRRGAGQETEGADEPAQPQKGGGQGRDATAEKRIRDVRPDVRMRFMDGAKLSRGGWTSTWVDEVCINWEHKYPKKEDFLLFGTLLGKEREKVVIRWFDEGHDLGWSDECEEKYRFPLKFASEHVTLLKEGASWDNIPSYRPGKR
eukprot:jgi/Mesvir1/16658/Mv10194-RA.1